VVSVSSGEYQNLLFTMEKDDSVWGLPRMAFVALAGKLPNQINREIGKSSSSLVSGEVVDFRFIF